MTKTCSQRNKLDLLCLEDTETIKNSYLFPSMKFQEWHDGISLERERQAICYYYTLYLASLGRTTVPFCNIHGVLLKTLASASGLLMQPVPTGTLIAMSWLGPHFCCTTKSSLGSCSHTAQLRPSRVKHRSHDVALQKQRVKHEECDLWCIRSGSI